jgi:hypothetical protein
LIELLLTQRADGGAEVEKNGPNSVTLKLEPAENEAFGHEEGTADG